MTTSHGSDEGYVCGVCGDFFFTGEAHYCAGKPKGFQPAKSLVTEERKTLRDEFAMAALSGLAFKDPWAPNIQENAYRIADAMLEARKK